MANAKSDIQLTDDFDGQVKVLAPDFCVDGGPGRRKGSDTPYRRALVHDGNDGLTINWANDYSGGVTINGVRTLTAQPGKAPFPIPTLTVDATSIGSLSFNTSALTFTCTAIHLKSHQEQSRVKITGDVQTSGNVQFDGNVNFTAPVEVSKTAPPPRPGMAPIFIKYNVLDQLLYLNGEVQKLKEKVGIA